MAKRRVPLHGNPANYVVIDSDATAGAIIGTNLYNADGSLFDPATLLVQVEQMQSAGVGVPAQGQTVITWSAVHNIPAGVLQAGSLSGTGFIRRHEGGTWSASPIVNADLAGATTDGLAEGTTNLYYTDARVDARIELAATDQRIDAYGDLRIAADGSLRISP